MGEAYVEFRSLKFKLVYSIAFAGGYFLDRRSTSQAAVLAIHRNTSVFGETFQPGLVAKNQKDKDAPKEYDPVVAKDSF